MCEPVMVNVQQAINLQELQLYPECFPRIKQKGKERKKEKKRKEKKRKA
jgi:hypothetical protein